MKKIVALFVFLLLTKGFCQFSSGVDYSKKISKIEDKGFYVGGGFIGNSEDYDYQEGAALGNFAYNIFSSYKKTETGGNILFGYKGNDYDYDYDLAAMYKSYNKKNSISFDEFAGSPDVGNISVPETDLSYLSIEGAYANKPYNFGLSSSINFFMLDTDGYEESGYEITLMPTYRFDVNAFSEIELTGSYSYATEKLSDEIYKYVSNFADIKPEYSAGFKYKYMFSSLLEASLGYSYKSYNDKVFRENGLTNFDLDVRKSFEDVNVDLFFGAGANLESDFSKLDKPLPEYYYSMKMVNRFMDDALWLSVEWEYRSINMKGQDDYYLNKYLQNVDIDGLIYEIPQSVITKSNDINSSRVSIGLKYFIK